MTGHGNRIFLLSNHLCNVRSTIPYLSKTFLAGSSRLLPAMSFSTSDNVSEVEKDMAGNKRLLPAKKVLERYGIVDRTLHRWLLNKKIRFPCPVIVNRRRYFDEDDLEVWE